MSDEQAPPGGWTLEQAAARLAMDLEEGWFVNLGIGLPTLVANFLPPGREVILHSENGILGSGPRARKGEEDPDLVNAGKEPITLLPGGSYFSQADSFGMVRGSHIDVAVMGAFQVSKDGDLANWKLPSAEMGSIGGAMDLAAGARQVWILMEHCTRKGEPKVVERCTYPLTGARCVKRIYTNLAVVEVTDGGLELLDVAPGCTASDVQRFTGAPLVSRESRIAGRA